MALSRLTATSSITRSITRRQATIEAAIAGLIAGLMSMAVFGPVLRWIATGWAGGDMIATYVDSWVWRGFRYGVTDQFGYPLGMDKNYFPAVDITENNFAHLISVITGQPFLGVNLLIMLTFPVVAFLTYFLFRMTGLTGPLAIAGAVAFSFIPYHFGRALGHTYLSTLYSAITGMALVLLVGSGRFEQLVKHLRKPTTRRSTKVAVITGFAVLVLVTAWTGVYYAAFTLILGAAALIWRYAHRASWKALALEATPFVAILVLVVLGLLPSILTTWDSPPVGVISDRLPYESVVFAGFLAVALLPLPQSTIPGLGFYNQRITEAVGAAGFIENNAPSNFGTWVTAGALVVIIGALIARTRYPHLIARDSAKRVNLSFIVYLLIVTLLWFIPWGLNYLFAGTISPQIRAWNRLTPYLLLLLLLGAAAAIQHTRAARKPILAVSLAALVLALTFVDAILPFRSAYATSIKDSANITKAARAYAAQVNGAIPERCGVLQLPHMQYPEFGKAGDVNDYDHFWVSLINPEKGWSYGGIKATPAGIWANQLPDVPNDQQIALLRGAGFCAIHVDRRGWPDDEGAAVMRSLTSRFGPPVATADKKNWAMFDIRAASAADPNQTEAFLYQPLVVADPRSTHPPESLLTDSWWWTKAEQSTFTVIPTVEQVPVTAVRGTIAASTCGPRTVRLTLEADGQEIRQTLIAQPLDATEFDLILPTPSAEPVLLSVFATGRGCDIEDGPGVRYVQVGNLQTY